MKILSAHSQITSHPSKAIYQLWADPNTWTTWDPDVAEVRFEGEPAVGAKGWMRPTSGPASTFTIVALRADRLATTTSRLPGAVLSFEHTLEPSDKGSRISVTVSAQGPLSALWAKVLRKSFSEAAPRNIAGLLAHLDAA